ncbi:unnamed protein product [Phyllotreta striolata]|uniref:Sodium channel protein Nach n=1 Tax=Phyllotreta striolata TaxID=444603 RepID=A0A9N9TRC4_PHYSR|nr:unnamed protein product [Phyllotreta striolata]
MMGEKSRRIKKKKTAKKIIFSDIWRFFLTNTSIHGCKRISDKKISLLEKALWITFSLVSIVLTFIILQTLWNDYVNNPIFIARDPVDIPVTEISFPGVAICNINKISKKRALRFAETLHSQHSFIREKFHTVSDLAEALRLLANLYDYSDIRVDIAQTLQDILEKYDNLTDDVNLVKRLIHLAPACNEILEKCKWGGRDYECRDLLFTRETFDGFCCVFNYVKRRKGAAKLIHETADTVRNPYNGAGQGIDKGLQLTLKNNLEDYFSTTLETNGYIVSIFNPRDYADKSSGSLTEIVVNAGTEVFVSIQVSVVNSQQSIRMFPWKMRKCIFNDEIHTEYGDFRNSDCLAVCKMKAMKNLCQCVPFFDPIGDYSFCRLTDLPCLSNFYRKWTSYYPTGESSPSLNFEREDSINCEHCLPACNDQIYHVSVDTSPIKINSNNKTYVNVYFQHPFGAAYNRRLTQEWYQLLSNFGGFISLIMGLSFISFAEILLLVLKLIVYYYNRIINDTI